MPRRVALITRAGTYAGPALARRLARGGHALALSGAAPEQKAALEALGAEVLVIDGMESMAPPDLSADGWQQIVSAVLERFGRLDAASLFPVPLCERAFTRGPFLGATIGELHDMSTYLDTTFHALQALLPAMRERGGQIVLFTSDVGVRPVSGWSLYGAVRAAQSFLARAVALEHARQGICLNVIGSKNAVFAGFPGAPLDAISDERVIPGDWSASLESETPLGRVGTMEELASFALPLLDGSNRFQTAQYFSFSGGWHCA